MPDVKVTVQDLFLIFENDEYLLSFSKKLVAVEAYYDYLLALSTKLNSYDDIKNAFARIAEIKFRYKEFNAVDALYCSFSHSKSSQGSKFWAGIAVKLGELK